MTGATVTKLHGADLAGAPDRHPSSGRKSGRYTPPKLAPVPDVFRWILYARVSLDKFGREVSTDEQLFEMDEVLADDATPHEVVARFAEPHRSASRYASKVRAIFAEAIRMLVDGEADGILIGDVDRLTREPRIAEDLIDMCDPRMGGRRGVVIRSYTQAHPHDLRTASGRASFRDLVKAAAWQSDKTSEYVLRSRRARRRAGRPNPGGAYGWEGSEVMHPAESERVREVIDRFLAGEAMAGIAADFRARGIPRKRDGRVQRDGSVHQSKPWEVSAVRSILTTPRNFQLVRDPYAEGDGLSVGTFAAPASPEEWWQVQAQLDKRGKRDRYPRRLALLTGLATCSGCGQPMHRSRTADGRATLVCMRTKDSDRCGGGIIDAATVEDAVADAVVGWVDDMDLGAYITTPETPDVPRLKSQLEYQRAQLDKAIDRNMLPPSDPMHFDDDELDRVRVNVKATADQLSQLLKAATETSPLARYAGQPGALAAAWPDMPIEAQRDVIIEALNLRSASVTIDPSGARRGYNVKWNADDPAQLAATLERVHID